MKDIMFSIIIPVYNVEHYLEDCIESILKQDYRNYEIILVNDGSTDGSGRICDKYANSNDNIAVYHKKNQGISATRNEGLHYAVGTYIFYLDSDDFWICNNVLSEVEVALNRADYDFFLFHVVKYFSNTKQYVNPYQAFDVKKIDVAKVEDAALYLIENNQIIACAYNKCIKREFLLQHNIYFKKGILGEDIDWNLRLFLKAERIGALNKVAYAYRQMRSGSITNTVSKKGILDLYETICYWSKKSEESTHCRQFVLGVLAFEYAILLSQYFCLTNMGLKSIKKNIKDLRILLSYAKDRKTKMVYKLNRITGFYCTSAILLLYFKLKHFVLKITH